MGEQPSSSCPQALCGLAQGDGTRLRKDRQPLKKSASIRFRPLSPLDLSFPSCLASNTFLWSFSIFLWAYMDSGSHLPNKVYGKVNFLKYYNKHLLPPLVFSFLNISSPQTPCHSQEPGCSALLSRGSWGKGDRKHLWL